MWGNLRDLGFLLEYRLEGNLGLRTHCRWLDGGFVKFGNGVCVFIRMEGFGICHFYRDVIGFGIFTCKKLKC